MPGARVAVPDDTTAAPAAPLPDAPRLPAEHGGSRHFIAGRTRPWAAAATCGRRARADGLPLPGTPSRAPGRATPVPLVGVEDPCAIRRRAITTPAAHGVPAPAPTRRRPRPPSPPYGICCSWS